jgi:hypothetical protein
MSCAGCPRTGSARWAPASFDGVQRAPETSPEVEASVFQWEEGYRRLQEARSEPRLFRVLGRAVVAIETELRKRLGSSFTVAELARLYRQGSDWALDLAMQALPDDIRGWDPGVAADAAFYLYMREASDFAGGRARY